MKPYPSNNKSTAMTVFEVLVVVAIVMILAAVFLPGISSPHHHVSRLSCVNNLKQVGLAFRLWEGDNGDKYPMAISVTNGGAMELAAAGNAAAVFQVMSNELGTPKILLCPDDASGVMATNFTIGFTGQNSSYFAGVDATETNVQMLLSGDDNLEINGLPVKFGLVEFSTNAPINWSATRHKFAGNIAFADGSVQQFSQAGLQQAVAQTGVATNRLAVP
ncbi:MAG TPA: type II secretion system protein [Verrucomicrobiae bacterium]